MYRDTSLRGVTQDTAARQRREEVESALVQLEDFATHHGVMPDLIATLSDIAAETDTDVRLATRIIRCLIPRNTVPSRAVVTLLGGFGGMTVPLRALVLKWLVIVYDLIDDLRPLHALYGLLLHYIDYETLRPFLCNLLYRLTRREDAKPFRVRRLYQLYLRVGSEPWLLALLMVYRGYRRDITVLKHRKVTGRQFFRVPDRRMRDLIALIQRTYNPERVRSALLPFSVQEQTKTNEPKHRHKRQRTSASVIPAAETTMTSAMDRAVAIEEISSIDELVLALDRLALPDQLASILRTRFLRHAVSLRPHQGALARASHYLAFALEEEFFWAGSSGSRTTPAQHELLRGVALLAEHLHELPPGVEAFLLRYLRLWDGRASVAADVFAALQWLRPQAYEDVYIHVLKPLNRLFLSGSAPFRAQLIQCITCMLRNWCDVDWKKVLARREEGAPSGPRQPYELYAPVDPAINHYATMREIMAFADQLGALALQAERNHPLVQHAVLSFFEFACTMHTAHQLPFVFPPSTAIVYRCFLAGSAFGVSRLCGVFARYREEFDRLKAAGDQVLATQTLSFQNGLDRISTFNSFILDMCNALWRNLVYTKHRDAQESLGFALPSELEEALRFTDMNYALSLTHSAAFAPLAWRFLHGLEQRLSSARQVELHPKMIRDRFKFDFLEYLKKRGFVGLYNFLFTFIRFTRRANPST